MKKYINNILSVSLVTTSVLLMACTTDDLEPTLAQDKEDSNAFENVADMEGVLKGMYNRLTPSDYYGRDYLVTNEVRTPNTWSNGQSGRFVSQAGFNQGAGGLYIWDDAYAAIASANILIGLNIESLEGNLEYARHIQGQAYAIRALAHFDLLKTYGQQHSGGSLGIPYVKEFKGEDLLPARGTVEENRAAIMEDLDQAFEFMDEQFFDPSKEFLSKYGAPALKSRVAVYFGDWETARDAAERVIESNKYSVPGPEQFLESWASDGGVNSILELAYGDADNPGTNSMEQIYRGCTYGDISATEEVYNNLYESEDDVRTELLGTEECDGVIRLRNAAKFPRRDSNINVIRYEEVVLNYAEALFELGEGDPLQWLNLIPENRNADLYSEVTKENILEERREEFLFEGLYYWDLLRTGQNIVREQSDQPINIPYGDHRLTYPIPLAELDANSNLIQNPGYQS